MQPSTITSPMTHQSQQPSKPGSVLATEMGHKRDPTISQQPLPTIGIRPISSKSQQPPMSMGGQTPAPQSGPSSGPYYAPSRSNTLFGPQQPMPPKSKKSQI